MTDVLVMPGVRPIYVPDLSVQQKAARIEQLASATGLTPDMTHDLLLTVAHPWLVGDALMDAWVKTENAIQCRDATARDDADYEGYEDAAADRIHDVIHGTNISTARGSGITSRGNAS